MQHFDAPALGGDLKGLVRRFNDFADLPLTAPKVRTGSLRLSKICSFFAVQGGPGARAPGCSRGSVLWTKSTWFAQLMLRLGLAAPALVGRLGLVLHHFFMLIGNNQVSCFQHAPCTPIGNRRSKYTVPSVSSAPIGGLLLQDHRAFVQAVGRAEDGQAGLRCRRAMIGQLIDDGPRYFGSSEGWYWIVPCFGILTNSCGANCSTKAMMPMSAPSSFIASCRFRGFERL